jgi:hypothetical protein
MFEGVALVCALPEEGDREKSHRGLASRGMRRIWREAERRRTACWILAVLSFLLLLARGWHNVQFGFRGDDSQLFLGVQQWLERGTFYENLDYARIAPPDVVIVPEDHDVPNAYPPHTVLFYLPFYFFGWQTAHVLWFGFNIVCFVVLGLVLFRQFGKALPRAALPLWLTALFLSFPPYDVAFLGHISLPILLALALAWVWMHRPGPSSCWIAGGFLAMALIKPTIALPFVAYHLLRRGTRRAAVCGLLLTFALNLVVMARAGDPRRMLNAYRSELRTLTQSGGMNDTAYPGPRRLTLTTASVSYFDAVGKVTGHTACTPANTNESRTVLLLELLVGVIGVSVFARHALRLNRNFLALTKQTLFSSAESFGLCALSVFSLLVFYHSWTDTCMLLLPLLVVWNARAGLLRWERRTLLALLFFILFIRREMVFGLFSLLDLPLNSVDFLRYTLMRGMLFVLLALFLRAMTRPQQMSRA